MSSDLLASLSVDGSSNPTAWFESNRLKLSNFVKKLQRSQGSNPSMAKVISFIESLLKLPSDEIPKYEPKVKQVVAILREILSKVSQKSNTNQSSNLTSSGSTPSPGSLNW